MSFRIETEKLDDYTLLVRPIGAISGDSDLSGLIPKSSARVILDLANISRIDSLGVREWIRAMQSSGDSQTIVWERVSPAMSSQVGMITNFVGRGSVASFILPWWCQACGNEHTTDVEAQALKRSGLESPECPKCGATMMLDELDEGYIDALLEHAP
ncbi:MAG: hypothetical protein VX223_11380 [Myxococcota bacterium]|nr:hypothetical protein [Myxococcota bacterium]